MSNDVEDKHGVEYAAEVKELLLAMLAKEQADYREDYQLISHSDLFDAAWYLKQNPDVEKHKMDPVEHYLKFGWKEGRDPSPKFSGKMYLESYNDVREAHINPLLHYEKLGRKESRHIFSSVAKC